MTAVFAVLDAVSWVVLALARSRIPFLIITDHAATEIGKS